MLNKITLITGGCHSGKSQKALSLALFPSGQRFFIATCPRIHLVDPEMELRILNHQKGRKNLRFKTIEEQIDLKSAFQKIDCEVKEDFRSVVVDCISLWVNNWMYELQKKPQNFSELDMTIQIREIVDSAKNVKVHIFFVTNEVGLGIVPENKMGRQYRDLLGRANQELASAADEVLLMISGLTLKVK